MNLHKKRIYLFVLIVLLFVIIIAVISYSFLQYQAVKENLILLDYMGYDVISISDEKINSEKPFLFHNVKFQISVHDHSLSFKNFILNIFGRHNDVFFLFYNEHFFADNPDYIFYSEIIELVKDSPKLYFCKKSKITMNFYADVINTKKFKVIKENKLIFVLRILDRETFSINGLGYKFTDELRYKIQKLIPKEVWNKL